MALESMIAPVPSELVMPFAGFLTADGHYSFVGMIVASSFGSIAGSFASYGIGRAGGNALVLRFGRYLLLDERHLEQTERFFARHGEKTIFFARLIPVVRHLISIPAGIGRMNIPRFLLYTVAGATIWNATLAALGLVLREQWHLIHEYSRIIDYIVVALGAAAILYVLRRHLVHARRERIAKGAKP
jgi:membrane protein DedA with SNARE-associated domain